MGDEVWKGMEELWRVEVKRRTGGVGGGAGGGVVGLFFTVEGRFWESLGKRARGKGRFAGGGSGI